MVKKEFTSFDVAAVIRELKETILDCRISNIYQLDSKTLLFKLRKPDKPDLRLILEAGRRIHLTSYVMEKPLVPPAFCMALRSHLRNGWLVSVEQYGFERIIVFHFKTKADEFKLALELFGEGNIILVNGKDKITHALVYKRMRDRNIVRDEIFRYPPPGGRDPFKVSKEEMKEGLRNLGDVEVVRALARFLSVGGFYAEEILLRADVEKTKHCSVLSDSELDAIFVSLHDLLSQVAEGKLQPNIVLDEEGSFVDVVPLRLKRYEGTTHQPYGSFNEALDEFYVRVVAAEKAISNVRVEELKREAQRLERIIESQKKTLAEAEAGAQNDRRIGDAIYAHSSELQSLLDRFLESKKAGKDWNSIITDIQTEKRADLEPSAFFESFDQRSLVVNVCVDGLQFGLNLRHKLFENAGHFYDRSKRAKQKMEGANAALEETRRKLMEVESKIKKVEELEHVTPVQEEEEFAKRKVKHKEWFEKFRWFTSSDGFLVVAGKDAVSNEVLIKKHTDQHDIVFHADIVGAPFVVIKTNGKTPSDQCLREAGEFAAAFSKGWREGFGSIDVYWVKPEQLSKGGPSGEYVSRGGFVVSGKRNLMRNVPIRIAIGVSVEDDELRFAGGPIDAIKTKTNEHVTIVPGQQKSKELFKHVLKTLAAKMPKSHREKILKTSIEEIREFIPYNQGRVPESDM